MNRKHYSFPSVQSFHNTVATASKFPVGEREYIVKCKLHGTNSSIVFSSEHGVYAQSRNRILTVDSDNFGFAKFVEDNLWTGADYNSVITPEKDGYVVYGEFAGKGVQQSDAVSQIPEKTFFVFSLYDIVNDIMIVLPEEIAKLLDVLMPYVENVYILPALFTMTMDLNGNTDHLNSVSELINNVVDRFETVDPYIKEEFGIEAPGEGIVVSPITSNIESDDQVLLRDDYARYSFKSKTKAHRVNKSKKAAKAFVTTPEDVLDFVNTFATEQRFLQAVQEENLTFCGKDTGKFLKWVCSDVLKESKAELEASGLDWKLCARELTRVAKNWWVEQQ